ncbi:hypothetical protein RND81_08G168100 [Saponaria officinalis]|uniref:TF-B3 domain-containing protein n=1 Tax=Saponaria officinalis TaxID=3572 RepID=A0AAW1J912_SAPOF
MSTMERKMALVAKRLSMLHHDSTSSDSDETPLQCSIQPIKKERMSTKRKLITNSETHYGASVNTGKQILECKLEELNDNNNKSEEKMISTMDRAIKVQEGLSAAFPSFVKMLLPSHVSKCFWMYIPRKFCHDNLPKEDCTVTLVDEGGREFKTNYLVNKRGLSAGWRGFSIHHHLDKDDVLIFHLVRPTTFKVYIVREQRPELDTCVGQIMSENTSQMVHHTENSPPTDSLSPTNTDIGTTENTSQMVHHTEDNPPTESLSPTNNDIDLRPEVLDGIRFTDSDINFETITGFENFNIIVDGLVIDSKFSDTNKKKYYELCRSQNAFLHQRLLKGLNCNLVVGIILETVNIADAIKACTSATSIEDLRTWKTTLDGFELLGMKVSFLCAKLNLLLGISDESKISERCTFERTDASKRMKALEVKIVELKQVIEKIDFEIDAEVKSSVGKHETRIKEIANTPW